MTSAIFEPHPQSGVVQFVNNNVTNNSGLKITLSAAGSADIQIDNGLTVNVTKKVNKITAGAVNYYCNNSPALTAKVPASIVFTKPNVVVTW